MLRLESDRVSAEHAVVFHDGEGWFIRDLGSTNGTWLDGKGIEPGVATQLVEGTEISFGENDASHSWRLVSSARARARARCIETSEVCYAVEELLQLPSPDDVSMTVYFDGTQSEWFVETDGGKQKASDQSVVQVGIHSYLLELPLVVDITTATRRRENSAPSLHDARLVFSVSMDEEHVEVAVDVAETRLELPSRSYHYLLVTLARQRLRDSKLPTSERGWLHVEDLMKQLRVTRQKLNLDVSRARRQLAEAGVAHAAQLIERRPQASQLRLGLADLVVEQP